MTEDLDRKIIALEERVSFQERLLGQLDDVIVEHQHALDTLTARVRRLEERLTEGNADPREAPEKPPHY